MSPLFKLYMPNLLRDYPTPEMYLIPLASLLYLKTGGESQCRSLHPRCNLEARWVNKVQGQLNADIIV